MHASTKTPRDTKTNASTNNEHISTFLPPDELIGNNKGQSKLALGPRLYGVFTWSYVLLPEDVHANTPEEIHQLGVDSRQQGGDALLLVEANIHNYSQKHSPRGTQKNSPQKDKS